MDFSSIYLACREKNYTIQVYAKTGEGHRPNIFIYIYIYDKWIHKTFKKIVSMIHHVQKKTNKLTKKTFKH